MTSAVTGFIGPGIGVWLWLIAGYGVAAQADSASGALPSVEQSALSGRAEGDGSTAPPESNQGAALLPPMPPRETFDGIIERPLFSESRRPDAPVSDVEASSASELREQWKLTGIVMVGDKMKAMLEQRNGDKQLTLTPGMPLDASWMLEEIRADHVILGADGEQLRLDLLEPRDTTPVAAPASPLPANAEQDTAPDEVRPLAERAREATRRLQQDIQQNTEVGNE